MQNGEVDKKMYQSQYSEIYMHIQNLDILPYTYNV